MTFDRSGRNYILWYDLEATGSNDTDYLLEFGGVITDLELNELDSKQIVLPITSKMEETLTDVVRQMHTVNGLLEDCRVEMQTHRGSYALLNDEWLDYSNRVAEADKELSDWIKKYNGTTHMPAGGSGVSHYDKPKFVDRQLPLFSKRITHWSLDIGTVRRMMDLAGIQLTTAYDGATVNKTHRALDDARVHVDEVRRWIKWARWHG